MELKEFISETIKQIAEGTEEGKKHLKDKKIGIGVNAPLNGMPVKFDIAITSDTSDSSEVGGKITVASIFSVGGKKGTQEANSNVSRIQFTLSLILNP